MDTTILTQLAIEYANLEPGDSRAEGIIRQVARLSGTSEHAAHVWLFEQSEVLDTTLACAGCGLTHSDLLAVAAIMRDPVCCEIAKAVRAC